MNKNVTIKHAEIIDMELYVNGEKFMGDAYESREIMCRIRLTAESRCIKSLNMVDSRKCFEE